MLRLYDCHERTGLFDGRAFREAIELLESYVFRRSACDMQTRSLYQIFASIAYKIRDSAAAQSLKVALYRSGKKRRFPTDTEFRDALETRDVYAMRSCAYLLDRLENDSKEKSTPACSPSNMCCRRTRTWRRLGATCSARIGRRFRKPGCTAWAT